MKTFDLVLHRLQLVLLMISLFLLINSGSNAQPHKEMTPEEKQRIESMRIGHITTQLSLTSDEAQVFWPVYNQYQSELESLRKKRMKDRKTAMINFDEMSDKEAEKLVDDELSVRQTELDIKKKYHSEFKKVLPIKKVAKLYKAEHEFKRKLLNRFKHDRHEGRDKQQRPRREH